MNYRDPGLQPERTALSWRRTGYSMMVPGMLCLRSWNLSGDIFFALSGGLLFIGAMTMLCGFAQQKHLIVSLGVIISCFLMMMAVLNGYLGSG